MERNLVFVVQHMEEYLFPWCRYEYQRMLQYTQGTNIRLCFTNCKSFLGYQGPKSQENQENIEALRLAFQAHENQGIMLEEPYNQLVQGEELDLKKLGKFNRKQVCLLDLRAEKELTTGDNTTIDVFVFGGILGDHPPRDRTKLLRTNIETMRHLGQPQLSTDTAVLVSKLILKNGLSLQQIPFVLEPEIHGLNRDKKKSVIQMQGFRYVDQTVDWQSGAPTNKAKGEFYVHDQIRRILLEDQLDVASFM